MDLERATRIWHIDEGDFYLFHLETPLQADASLRACLARIDQRYLGIRHLLGQGPLTTQERERLYKANYWLYSSAFDEADLPPDGRSLAYGTVSTSGIAFAQHKLSWDDPDLGDSMLHEEIHLWWTREVGEAPSLLNEGIAVYGELLLSPRRVARLPKVQHAWRAVVEERQVSLSRLARNEQFWESYRNGLPVYLVAGGFTMYFMDRFWIDTVKGIFNASHYDDERLVELIEAHTQQALAHIEAEVGPWLRAQ